MEKFVVITAPSGGGKTSLIHAIREEFTWLKFSVSACTRSPRNNEQDGVDYHFLSLDQFQTKIQNNEFVEWEKVYEGKYYGTLKSEIINIIAENKIPVLDVDVHGALELKEKYKDNAVVIFIKPPTIEELQKRLLARGTEDVHTLKQRLDRAEYELSLANDFDYLIINDVFEDAVHNLKEILEEIHKTKFLRK